MVDSGKPKHTPGPWNACHDSDGDFMIFAGEGLSYKVIAITDLDSATDEANAGLLVAAPDMLDALRNIRTHMDDLAAYFANCNTQVIIENLEATIRVLREKTARCDAAIRKAVGDGR